MIILEITVGCYHGDVISILLHVHFQNVIFDYSYILYFFCFSWLTNKLLQLLYVCDVISHRFCISLFFVVSVIPAISRSTLVKSDTLMSIFWMPVVVVVIASFLCFIQLKDPSNMLELCIPFLVYTFVYEIGFVGLSNRLRIFLRDIGHLNPL